MLDRQLTGPRTGNRVLLVVLLILFLAGLIYFTRAEERIVLAIYYLPAFLAAYFFGRKGGTLAAIGSVVLIGFLMGLNAKIFAAGSDVERWVYAAVWGFFPVLSAYLLGSAVEQKETEVRELRDTYYGILQMLHQFAFKDEYTQHHSYRVSMYASRIAAAIGLPEDRIEDVRAAALLRDLGKLDIGREILYKAAKLSREELEAMQSQMDRGAKPLSPVGGSLRRVLPILLEPSSPAPRAGETQAAAPDKRPLESRILAVADVYDSLTSDRPYRRGMSPEDARDVIVRGSGREFDPDVVDAFEKAFERRELAVPAAAD